LRRAGSREAVRVGDAENSIYRGLYALDWFSYLRAMWVISGELEALYEDRMGDTERSLTASTLDVVSAAAAGENVTAEIVQRAQVLADAWEKITTERENEVRAGQWNMWMVLGILMAELAGTCEKHFAAGRVNLAATERFREDMYRAGPRYFSTDEEIDDASPMARMLKRIQCIVTGVANMPEAMPDPAAVRARLADELDRCGTTGAGDA
jgi:hypothetical protein